MLELKVSINWEAFRSDSLGLMKKRALDTTWGKRSYSFIFKEERVRTWIVVYAHRGIIEGGSLQKSKVRNQRTNACVVLAICCCEVSNRNK